MTTLYQCNHLLETLCWFFLSPFPGPCTLQMVPWQRSLLNYHQKYVFFLMSFIVCVKTINRNTCLFYISLFLYLLSLLHYQGYLCQIRHQCNIAETGVILRLLCLHTNMLQFWIHHYPLEH